MTGFDGADCTGRPNANPTIEELRHQRGDKQAHGLGRLPQRDGRRSGFFSRELVSLLAQSGVLVLERKYHGDAGEVETRVKEVPDAAKPVQVIGTVATRATSGSGWGEQPACLVCAEILYARADKVGGNRDPVDALGGARLAVVHHLILPEEFSLASNLARVL
jgi:hypothetical protein